MSKKLWIVYEDCHGDVSYWDDRDKAYEEARDVIMLNPYTEDGKEVRRESITDEDIDQYKYCVGVRERAMNKTWAY